MRSGRRGGWVIVATFLVSLLLTVAPLPDWVDWVRPVFPLLVILYWPVVLPDRCGTWSGWWLGLLMDVLRGSPLGAHALAFAVAGFGASRLSSRMKVYPMPQQVIVVGLLVGTCMMLLRMVGNLTGTTTAGLLPYLLPVLVTALCWPWALALLDRVRRAFGVN